MLKALKNYRATMSSLMFLAASGTAIAQTDLVFVMDGSGSIDANDFSVQKTGIQAALANPLIIPRDGSVGVSIVQFAGSSTRTEMNYLLIDEDADVNTAQAAVGAISQLGGGTNPGDGVNTASGILAGNARDTAQQTICLSTDGTPNSGADIGTAINGAKGAAYGLDVFGVLAIEDPPFFFRADAESTYGPLTFGGGSVFVVANSIEFANVVGTVCFPDDKKLVGLEVTQSAQDLKNSVKLIKDKTTLVRAYLEPKEEDKELFATARLIGRRGGSEIGRLTPINPGGSIKIKKDVKARRGDKNATLNFQLPKSWLNGTVELEVEGVGGTLECMEAAGPSANDCKATVTFDTDKKLEVKFVGVKFQKDGAGDSNPTNAQSTALGQRMLAISPTATLDVQKGVLDLGNIGASPRVQVNTILTRLERMRALDGCGNSCKRFYYGYITPSAAALGNGRGGLTGGRANGIPGKVSAGRMVDGDSYGYNRHVHEIAHTMGRHHAVAANKSGPCGSGAGNAAPTFPYISGGKARLGPMSPVDDMVYGYDSLRDKILDPNTYYELMSYCKPKSRWISKFTYEGMYGAIPAASPAQTSAQMAMMGDSWLVSGLIDLDSGSATFDPILKAENQEAIVDGPTPTEYVLEVLDGNDAVLSTYNLEVVELHDDVEADQDASVEPNMAMFIRPIAVDAMARSVRIMHNGNPIGSMAASSNAPAVAVTFPNGGETLSGDTATITWTGSDSDGDNLSYSILFSADNGATWTALTTDYQGTSIEINLNQLTQTNQGLIQVVASDGFNTTVDMSDAPFTAPNNLPDTMVTGPGDDSSFFGVQPINLSVLASDTEDGNIPDANISWSSDIDGLLGTGANLVVLSSDLSEGQHQITVTVTDSLGGQSTDNVLINVARVFIPALADAGPDFTADEGKGVNLNGSGSTGQGLTFSWTQVAGPTVNLQNANTATPSFTAPQVGNNGDIVVLQLTVTNNQGVSSTDTINITINSTNLPICLGNLQVLQELQGGCLDPDSETPDLGQQPPTDGFFAEEGEEETPTAPTRQEEVGTSPETATEDDNDSSGGGSMGSWLLVGLPLLWLRRRNKRQ